MIHGITPTLAEGGKIKIGGLGDERQKKDGGGTFRMPRKDDHFTITKTFRDKSGDLVLDQDMMTALRTDPQTGEVFTGKLTELPIVIHSDEIDEVFPTSYALYAARKLACYGDGQRATRWEIKAGKKTGVSKERACTCEDLTGPKARCKPHGTLHCSLRVPGCAVAGSVYKWRTTSIISIQQMIGSLLQVQQLTHGVLQGIPLWLVLREVEVAPDDAPSSRVYVCHIELRGADLQGIQRQVLELMQTRNAFARELEQSRQQYRALITAPAGDEDDQEQAEVAAEFHPSKMNSEVVDKEPTEEQWVEAERQAAEARAADPTVSKEEPGL